jgi:hypothetical protein
MVVNEPSTCTARRAVVDNSTQTATLSAPKVSLDAFDRGVCILNEELP